MKLLRRKKSVSLDDRLAGLEQAADLADGRLGADAVSGARSVISRAGVRRSLSVDHTAVALAGATGSGKSSLFNLLSGTSLATVGVTRPTTSIAQAALWEGTGAGSLLDWLEIPRRHEVSDVPPAIAPRTRNGGQMGIASGPGPGGRGDEERVLDGRGDEGCVRSDGWRGGNRASPGGRRDRDPSRPATGEAEIASRPATGSRLVRRPGRRWARSIRRTGRRPG